MTRLEGRIHCINSSAYLFDPSIAVSGPRSELISMACGMPFTKTIRACLSQMKDRHNITTGEYLAFKAVDYTSSIHHFVITRIIQYE